MEKSNKIMDIAESIFIANPSHLSSAVLVDKYRARLHQQSHDKYLQKGPFPLSFQCLNGKTVLCQLSGVSSISTMSLCVFFLFFLLL